MNVEYINPFIEASQSVWTMMTGNKPVLGKVYLKKVPYQSDDVAVIVGLTGKIRGQVVISMRTDTALKVVSSMMARARTINLQEHIGAGKYDYGILLHSGHGIELRYAAIPAQG